MPLRRFLTLVISLALMVSACVGGSETQPTSAPAPVTAPDGATTASGPLSGMGLERTLPEIMTKAGVPGLSYAVLEEGKVAWVGSVGVRSTESQEPVNDDTVFAAASLSKSVFAYLVMLLTQDGTLDLDRPLEEYLGAPLGEHPNYADLAGDDRTGAITARHVLSHSVGFPNWRFLTDDGKLRLLFDPGARFNYSGEGIALLQLVVEAVTGRGLEELAQERIFGPLGMTRTSYVWQERFEDNHAVPHDGFERPRRLDRRRSGDDRRLGLPGDVEREGRRPRLAPLARGPSGSQPSSRLPDVLHGERDPGDPEGREVARSDLPRLGVGPRADRLRPRGGSPGRGSGDAVHGQKPDRQRPGRHRGVVRQ